MAKFKVGDRVRIRADVPVLPCQRCCLGREAVVERAYIGASGQGYFLNLRDSEGDQVRALEYTLEPITDTWAQDKVAQLVKQCMPVAA